MGHGFCVNCYNCDEGECFTLGVGMMYSSLLNVISCIKGGAQKKVVDIMQNHDVMDAEFEHRLYACPSCQTLHERFYFFIEYDEGETYTPAFRCGKCRTPLIPADESKLEKYACKECGKHTLVRGAEMLWD